MSVNHYEDFTVGRRFDHHWGRTIGEEEAIEFATAFLLHEPALFNDEYARHLGHRGLVVSPLFTYSVVLGLSVEDLSESGGSFLGSDAIAFGVPVHAGDTVYASSVVLSHRPSRSRRGMGIVEWRTGAVNQRGDDVVRLRRRNLVLFRSESAWSAEVER